MVNGHCVIVGASHAGVTLAMQLRKEGWEGAISLIGAEPELPYHRPPLSKECLAGEKTLDAMRLRPEQAFIGNAIDLKLGLRVTALDRARRRLTLDDGGELEYDRLALCTGSRVNTIALGEGLQNIFYVRTAADVSRIRPLLQPKRHAVIIGAGYIGLETAAVLSKLGLKVTLVEMAERILQRVTGEQMSACLRALHEKAGVNILTATAVSAIEGAGRVERVVCRDGTGLPADLVIAGVGVSPDTGLAEAAGLETAGGNAKGDARGGGIVVDEYTRTSDENIFAAGDCTVHPSIIYGRPIHLESVQNATEQARCAAANIRGKARVYDAVPWFWSNQYGLSLQIAGLSEGADTVIPRGEPVPDTPAGFVLFYLKDGKVIAADCVNRPGEFMVSKQLVRQGLRIPAEVLADESVKPNELPGYGR